MDRARARGLKLFANRIAARSHLGDDERRAILELPGQIATVQTNEDFVRPGEVVDKTCLVVDGLLGRFAQTRDGQRQISAVYIPGDMPDLHSFVMPRSAWALMGLTKTTVFRVPHAAIAEVIERFPVIGAAFWRDCTTDAMLTSEWILNIGRRNAQARTAHFLCEMATRYEQIDAFPNLRFPLPLTQVHMADALALTPVHVNRMLKKLKDDGVVHVTRQSVHVLDWGRLISIADFDPGYLNLDARAKLAH